MRYEPSNRRMPITPALAVFRSHRLQPVEPFTAKDLEDALPLAEDPIYAAALAVEQDGALNAEMKEWHDACIADGIREYVDMNGCIDATR